ncbi:MAG TPA: hypothetical protein PKO33_13335 [Pyrinomonadaceae bacterium]|nr:hypothetical protein [Pyrinomonadaceae bacterium]
MNKKNLMIAVVALSLAAIACSSIVDRVMPGPEMKKADSMWTDVPTMDDMKPNDLEMPAALKIVLRTIIGNMGRLNKEGEDQTTGNIDWLVFSSPQPPAEIQKFYTNDKMNSFGGWDTSKESTCAGGNQNEKAGVFCVFQKKADGKKDGLVIIVAEDEKTKGSNIFFVRIETDEKPNANKP